MPHLQERKSLSGGSTSPSSHLPIQEARKGLLNDSVGLLSLAASVSNRVNPKQFDSSSPSSIENTRTSTNNNETTHIHTTAAATPLQGPKADCFVTPSPSQPANRRKTTHYGPMLTIYGNTKLVTSPIRVKKRPTSVSPHNTDTSSTGTDQLSETNIRSKRSHDESSVVVHGSSIEQADFEEALKKQKLTSGAAAAYSAYHHHHHQQQYTPSHEAGKKPIISPTSSGETVSSGKGDEDSAQQHPAHEAPQQYAPGYYHGAHAGHHGAHPYPGPSPYAMYGAYPPPPPPSAHYMRGHPNGVGYYAPYPPPHHPGMQAAAYRGMRYPPPGQHALGGAAPPPPPPAVYGIKSVTDWQHAAVANGRPPSANRCIPLKEPIPSKFWGEAKKTQDALLPDFHRLVNFPDYLAKARSSRSSETSKTPAGKKNCVMCGKLRVCSATSLARGRGTKQTEEVPSSEDGSNEEEEGDTHIIPRQNKGLCTACDVTVWVISSDGMEIKWCKGCKNFRPWAAFGDKGSATKCVRCRERQREKYAMQKDEIRLRRYKRGSAYPATTQSGEEKKEDEADRSAANGLQTLMSAAQAV